MIVWITGKPGAGKTTFAHKLQSVLGHTVVLDGDDSRRWLTPDCGFTPVDRVKHAERIWKVADLVSKAGGTCVVSVVAHPPQPVEVLVLVEGPSRKPMWDGTDYTPPENPNWIIKT